MSEKTLTDELGQVVLGPLDPDRPEDHLALVQRAARAHRSTAELLAASVASARASGHSWAALGEILGMSRQAAQQRFGDTAPASDQAKGEGSDVRERRRLGPVTAFDEMAELEIAGRQGWRTVGAGMFYHLVERTDTQWEHRRVVWTRPSGRLERGGWQVAVRAFPWVYLVRDLQLPADPAPDPG